MKKKKRLAKKRAELKKQRASEYRRLSETSELEKENILNKEDKIVKSVESSFVADEEIIEPVVEETFEEKLADRERKIDALSTTINKKVDLNELHRNFNQMEKAARQRETLLKTREILTRIYASDITIEEIEKSTVTKWQRVMLIIAYYDKNNRKLGLETAKQSKKEFIESPNKLKTLNAIIENLKSKKSKVFSVEYYTKILGVTIDFELASKISEEKNKQEETKEENVVIETKKEESVIKEEVKVAKKEKVKPVIIGSTGTLTNRFTNSASNSNRGNNENSSNRERKEVILIRDVFEDEIIELKKYIYVEMNAFASQKDAIKAWDVLEEMILKPISDKQALTKFIELLRRLQKYDQLKTQFDEVKLKKYAKYLEK